MMALDKTIEQWLPYFHRAGFDEFAIDLTYVPDDVLHYLGECLMRREKLREFQRKLLKMQEQGGNMEFLLERKLNE